MTFYTALRELQSSLSKFFKDIEREYFERDDKPSLSEDLKGWKVFKEKERNRELAEIDIEMLLDKIIKVYEINFLLF
jgi:hypothetical protein